MGIRNSLAETFTFPNPVNEVSARVVAGGVVILSLATIVSGAHILVFLLLYGFLARMASGPRFSPLGQIATKLIVPKLGLKPKMVSGPPKRFAQSIGFVFSLAATLSYFALGATTAGNVILAVLTVFAFMESVIGFCAGCKMFALAMKLGLIPEEVCIECANIWTRQKSPAI